MPCEALPPHSLESYACMLTCATHVPLRCNNCRVIFLCNFIVLDSEYYGPEIASNCHLMSITRLNGVFPGSLDPEAGASDKDNELILTTIHKDAVTRRMIPRQSSCENPDRYSIYLRFLLLLQVHTALTVPTVRTVRKVRTWTMYTRA